MLWGGRWEGGSCLGMHVRIKDFKIKKNNNNNLKNKTTEIVMLKNMLMNLETNEEIRNVRKSRRHCFTLLFFLFFSFTWLLFYFIFLLYFALQYCIGFAMNPPWVYMSSQS